MTFYNEIAKYPAAWLRNLAAAGHIADGRVDERSIRDLAPGDVSGDEPAHFFAGIGAWSHALRLARVPDGLPLWTGSCPCQPFSVAGQGGGFDDERHLWPEWFRLIRECRPSIILGEQVAGRAGLEWLDLVSADLEGCGYSFAAAVLPACSVGAPHRRERIAYVAHANGAGRLLERFGWVPEDRDAERRDDADGRGEVNGFWSGADWVKCNDPIRGEVWRPVEPGLEPLVDGSPGRVGRLRAYGNAIVAPMMAEFIMEAFGAICEVSA